VAGVALGVALLYTGFVLVNTLLVGPATQVPLPWLASWLYVQDGLDIVAAALLISGGALVLDRLLAREQAHQAATMEHLARIEAQRQLLADTSHELRNPLTVLRTNLALLQHENLDLEGRLEVARDAEEEAARLARLVDDLLLLGRGDAGDLLAPEPVRLDVLVEEVAAEAEEAGTGHVIRIEALQPTTVMADPERLRQVLRNLVGNALYHTPPGTEVRLALAGAGGGGDTGDVMVRIADNGPGIPPEHQPRVFDRFYRVERGKRGGSGDAMGRSATSRGGAGLGLTIARHLVEAHGGRVRLESEPGRGTEVCLWLPRGCQPAHPAGQQLPNAR
jgi:two-component system OmpR family sensor kinase